MNLNSTILFILILTIAQVFASSPVTNDLGHSLADGMSNTWPDPVSEPITAIRSLDRSGQYFRAILHSTTSELNEYSQELQKAYYGAAVVNIIRSH